MVMHLEFVRSRRGKIMRRMVQARNLNLEALQLVLLIAWRLGKSQAMLKWWAWQVVLRELKEMEFPLEMVRVIATYRRYPPHTSPIVGVQPVELFRISGISGIVPLKENGEIVGFQFYLYKPANLVEVYFDGTFVVLPLPAWVYKRRTTYYNPPLCEGLPESTFIVNYALAS